MVKVTVEKGRNKKHIYYCIAGLGEFLASPQDLGPGSHELTIVCMDFDGYSDTQHVKFNLNAPPIPRKSLQHSTAPLNNSITFFKHDMYFTLQQLANHSVTLP